MHRWDELLSSGLPQIRQTDGDDEKGLEAFSQRDDECLKHKIPETEIESQFNLNARESPPRSSHPDPTRDPVDSHGRPAHTGVSFYWMGTT